MKKISTCILAIVFSTMAFAQQPDKVLARISYQFTHTRDTLQRQNPYTENMILMIGKNASVYTSLDNIGRELRLPSPNEVANAPFKPVTLVDYYFFFKEKKFFTREKLFTNYMIEEQIPKISWKLSKDTSRIAGVDCKKATAQFKGRNWTVWYAPSLPFQSGPWKLNGLPGLILSAYDDKKEVVFAFGGIDNLSDPNMEKYNKSFYFGSEIKAVPDTKLTTRVAFDKLMAAYKKDPKGFAATETGVSVNRIYTGVSMTGVSHTVINNPIELTP